MWDDDEGTWEGKTWCRHVDYFCRKALRGPQGLTSPFNGRMKGENRHQFICKTAVDYALERYVRSSVSVEQSRTLENAESSFRRNVRKWYPTRLRSTNRKILNDTYVVRMDRLRHIVFPVSFSLPFFPFFFSRVRVYLNILLSVWVIVPSAISCSGCVIAKNKS